jgi:lysozyme
VSIQNDPDPLIRQLVLHEGVRNHAYQDSVGLWTIGVGRNIDKKGPGLSDGEIRILLLNDIAACGEQLDVEIPWWRSEDEVRRDVMVDLCFNMGIHGLLGFVHTLSAWNHHDYEEAARGLMDSKWARDVQPSRRDRLVGMLRTGVRGA